MSSSFSFSVFVGGEPLKEYEVDGATYIEANLHSSSSYIIEDFDDEGYKQQYPVTPFEVRGTFTNTLSLPCYLKLCVDGQQIWMKPFAPSKKQQRFTVSGLKDVKRGIVKELLFSLPKIASQKDHSSKTWTAELGTITLECLEALDEGYFQTYNKKFYPLEELNLSSKTHHQQASKLDCMQNGGIGMSTREGREFGAFYKSSQLITMKKYRLGSKTFGKLTLHYRPRVILEELGVVDENWASADQDRRDTAKNRKTVDFNDNVSSANGPVNTNNVKIENNNVDFSARAVKEEAINGDMNTVISKFNEMHTDQSSKKMYCFSPSRVNIKKEGSTLAANDKLGCFSPTCHREGKLMEPCQIKKEKIGEEEQMYRYIEIDNDIMMLQEVDDDVVWMGDDSCCFIDVEPEEVPLIDLVQ